MFIITLSEVVGAIILLLIFGAWAIEEIKTLIYQSKCKHSKYRETSNCDAICIECGKNLGFIENSRKVNPEGERG